VLHSPVEVRGIFANRDLKRQGSNHTESGLHLGAGAPKISSDAGIVHAGRSARFWRQVQRSNHPRERQLGSFVYLFHQVRIRSFE